MRVDRAFLRNPLAGLGLRARSLLFFAMVFLVVGAIASAALYQLGVHQARALGGVLVERHVLWHKEKVLGAVQRELALARQMASSTALLRWARDDSDPASSEAARRELARFRENFAAKSFFLGLEKSRHFYFTGKEAAAVSLEVVSTLRPDAEDDAWYFASMNADAPFNLNVDYNEKLDITNLWVNYIMQDGPDRLGVVGTGVLLTDFIDMFVKARTEGIEGMLIDANGAIQAHGDQTLIVRNSFIAAGGAAEEDGLFRLLSSDRDRTALAAALARLQVMEPDSAVLTLNLEGREQLVGIAWLQPLRWYSVAILDPGSVFPAGDVLLFAGALALSFLVAAVLLFVGQNAMLMRPLAHLTQGAQALARGDYDARVQRMGRDELGLLADTMNDMAAKVANSTRSMAETVEARTRELAAKEAQLRVAMDNMPGGMCMVDSELRVQVFNEEIRRLFDFPEEYFRVGGSILETRRYQARRGDFGQIDDAKVVAETKALFAGGESIGYDRLFKNGRHVSVRANPAPGGGSVIVCADITALKQAEAEVRRSEAILRSILDQSPISFALKDTDRRFLMVNKVGADWFGFDREKMIGAPSEAINPTDQADMFAAADRRVLESGEPIRPFEYRDEAPFRAPMDLVVYKFPVLGAEGELIGVGTIQTDITERKRAEQELHKAYTIIRESVQYASKMQRALLPPEADLEALGDHLVIWEPRDVVGGDLFWLRRTEGGLLLIVGDGTGHGVPGAFMTLVATSALNQALLEHPDGDPARLLRHMNGHVKYMLRQDVVEGEADDGMELGLCLIDASGGITFAGARFSLLEVADGEARELKGDKGGIGYRRVPVAAAFTNHRLTPAPGAAYYLVTDGFVDQVGGEKRRAFGKRRLLQKLVALRALPMAAQREALLAALADYRGTEPRRDDVTLVGFRPV